MASLFGSLPSAAVRNQGRSTALVAAAGGGGAGGSERALQWVYDDETANCMHCNTPFTLITRKVGALAVVFGHEGGTNWSCLGGWCDGSTTAGAAGTSSATTARRTSGGSRRPTRSYVDCVGD